MKIYHASAAAAFLACWLTAGAVRAQTVAYDSNTHHDFAVPHASVPAGQTFAAGWSDQKGGVYSITGNCLEATSADPAGYLHDLALRPAGDKSAVLNVKGTIFVPNGLPSPGTANGLVLRFQPGGTFYLFQLSPDTLYAYKIVAGHTVVSLKAVSVHPSVHDPYSLTASAVNAGSGVVLNASAFDTRTGKSIGTLSITDTSRPITKPGRAGVDSWVGNNAKGSMTALYSRVTFYRLAAASASAPKHAEGLKAFPKIGFIGDSITSGYNQVGGTITPGTNDAAALTIQKISESKGMVQADSGVAWSAYDQGSSGSSTADWLPGAADSLNGRAQSSFVSAFGKPDPATNPVWVLLMLGTNDVRSDHLFTAEQHGKNLQAITEDLVSHGFNVVINHAPAFVAPTSFNGVTWDAHSLSLLRLYLPAEKAVVASFGARAPGRVFLGDTSAFDLFAARPALFQEYGLYGGLHPGGQGGTEALARCWARAFRSII